MSQIALFGSYSRDEQTPESDIDLILDFNSVRYKKFVACAYTLEEIFPGKKVKVVRRDGIKPRYFDAIKPDLIYV